MLKRKKANSMIPKPQLCKDQPLAQALNIFSELNAQNVDYGIFKDCDKLQEAAAGNQDFNLLVARSDYNRLCQVLLKFDGLRTMINSFHDNAHSGREDWFVPDYSAHSFLHFDVHIHIRTGFKYNKVCRLYAFEAVDEWEHETIAGVDIPIASPMDQTRIIIARSAFREAGSWINRNPELPVPAHVAGAIFGSDWHQGKIDCRFNGTEPFIVELQRNGKTVTARRSELVRLRDFIKELNGVTAGSRLLSGLVHASRRLGYGVVHFLDILLPGLVIRKRRPTTGGILVALVGPDGSGKSTQTRLLRDIFSRKFDCALLYLGSGIDSGTPVRNFVRRQYMKRRDRLKNKLDSPGGAIPQRPTIFQLLLKNARALWGIWLALHRRNLIRRAHRLVGRGGIVICDRWPQRIEAGFMDGPVTKKADSSNGRIYSALSWLEWKLYDDMTSGQPDLTIQLVGGYELSETRKPGDLTQSEFQQRADLMRRMRTMDPAIQVVDASLPIEQVTNEIFQAVWEKIR